MSGFAGLKVLRSLVLAFLPAICSLHVRVGDPSGKAAGENGQYFHCYYLWLVSTSSVLQWVPAFVQRIRSLRSNFLECHAIFSQHIMLESVQAQARQNGGTSDFPMPYVQTLTANERGKESD